MTVRICAGCRHHLPPTLPAVDDTLVHVLPTCAHPLILPPPRIADDPRFSRHQSCADLHLPHHARTVRRRCDGRTARAQRRPTGMKVHGLQPWTTSARIWTRMALEAPRRRA